MKMVIAHFGMFCLLAAITAPASSYAGEISPKTSVPHLTLPKTNTKTNTGGSSSSKISGGVGTPASAKGHIILQDETHDPVQHWQIKQNQTLRLKENWMLDGKSP